MDAQARDGGRQAIQDRIMQVLSLDAQGTAASATHSSPGS